MDFRPPESPPPTAQFQHMSFFFAPLGRHSLLRNLRRHIHRAISTHLSSSTPGALPTCLLFVRLLSRHIHCASSTHLLFRFPLVATFLFFAPLVATTFCPIRGLVMAFFFHSRPSGNGKFGENRLCTRSGVAKAVAQFLHHWCLAYLGRHSRCAISAPVFFRRPSTSIVITVEYFQQMFSGCHKRRHLLRNSNTWFSRAFESAHQLRSCNSFIYFVPPCSPHPLRNFNVCLLIAALRRRKC